MGKLRRQQTAGSDCLARKELAQQIVATRFSTLDRSSLYSAHAQESNSRSSYKGIPRLRWRGSRERNLAAPTSGGCSQQTNTRLPNVQRSASCAEDQRLRRKLLRSQRGSVCLAVFQFD